MCPEPPESTEHDSSPDTCSDLHSAAPTPPAHVDPVTSHDSDDSSSESSDSPPSPRVQARKRSRRPPARRAPRAPTTRAPRPTQAINGWNDMESWVPSSIAFDNIQGPAHNIVSDNPVDFFEIFVPFTIISLLVTETNRYAADAIRRQQQTGKQKRRSRSHKWKPVDEEEMRQFLGLMFLTGIIQKPTLEHYWSTDEMFATPFFASIMTRDR